MKTMADGVWSPMPTPLDRRGKVDDRTLRRLVDYLIENGVDGLFPMGTTGEFAAFTRAERKHVIEVVVDKAAGRVPVMAGISDPALENVRGLAKDAEEAGADLLMATPPYYYSVDDDGVCSHYETLRSWTSRPVFVYNIPEWTHNFVSPDAFERLVDGRTVSGMKYTEYNLLNLLKFIGRARGKVAVLTGSDAMLSTCLEFGGRGGIVSVSNLYPKETSAVFDLFKAGEEGKMRRAQVDLLPAIEAAGVGMFPAGLKEGMKILGFPVGTVRAPQRPASREEKEKVRKLLERASESLGGPENRFKRTRGAREARPD
jgi:4-hydroxy-tetrahydrodipicolinate synthase